MKKEEFPTFLNEQPTIIFGRTGRELMLIAGGLTAAAAIWANTDGLRQTTGGTIAVIVLIVLTVLFSIVVALFSVAGRPLEEWIFILLYYIGMPKLYLYMPLEEENDQQGEQQKAAQKPQPLSVDPYDEDPSES